MWFQCNKLPFNVNKTKFILFGTKHVKNKQILVLCLNDIATERIECIKFLGVMIDERLNWKNHIQTC